MLMGLCGGSFFFHASLTRLGQHWDMTFTYGLSLSLAWAAGYRLTLGMGMRENARTKAVWLGPAVASTVLMYAIKWWVDGRVALPLIMVIGFCLLATLYLRERRRFNGWLLVIVVLMTTLAAFFRGIDLAKTGCEPMGWLQYHACWHLCTGLAAFFFLAFLRTERA